MESAGKFTVELPLAVSPPALSQVTVAVFTRGDPPAAPIDPS